MNLSFGDAIIRSCSLSPYHPNIIPLIFHIVICSSVLPVQVRHIIPLRSLLFNTIHHSIQIGLPENWVPPSPGVYVSQSFLRHVQTHISCQVGTCVVPSNTFEYLMKFPCISLWVKFNSHYMISL